MKVVIIDDEPLISDKLKRIMETGLRGMHTVCAFTDAQMALDYIEQEKPGVILTDIVCRASLESIWQSRSIKWIMEQKLFF